MDEKKTKKPSFHKKRILIVSSDTGEGHNSAAKILQNQAPLFGWKASIRKPLEESSKFNKLLANIYNGLMIYKPQWVNGYAKILNYLKPNEISLAYKFVYQYIAGLIQFENPNVILSVHPMLNHFIQRYVKDNKLNIPCYTFVTDPFPPFWKGWSSEYIDHYFVATEAARNELLSNGIQANFISMTPMPLNNGFFPWNKEKIENLRDEMNVKEPVVFINGSARGAGPILQLLSIVRQELPDSHVLILCGRNKKLKRRIELMNLEYVRVFGFIDDLYKLVQVSDLVITKPGALSTYETLTSGTPAILLGIGGIMPQERGLYNAAKQFGFAFTAKTFSEMRDILKLKSAGWREKSYKIREFYNPMDLMGIMERIDSFYGKE